MNDADDPPDLLFDPPTIRLAGRRNSQKPGRYNRSRDQAIAAALANDLAIRQAMGEGAAVELARFFDRALPLFLKLMRSELRPRNRSRIEEPK